jgi:hypothetical protein
MSEKPIPSSRMGSLFSTKKEASQSGVMSRESRVANPEQENPESRVMSHDSRDVNHEPQNRDTGVASHESGAITHESLLMKHESGIMNIDPHTLDVAVSQGCKDPRISAYSPLVMSVLRYLRKTTPEFSMSEVASSLLEDAIRERYPELTEQVEKALAKK